MTNLSLRRMAMQRDIERLCSLHPLMSRAEVEAMAAANDAAKHEVVWKFDGTDYIRTPRKDLSHETRD